MHRFSVFRLVTLASDSSGCQETMATTDSHAVYVVIYVDINAMFPFNSPSLLPFQHCWSMVARMPAFPREADKKLIGEQGASNTSRTGRANDFVRE